MSAHYRSGVWIDLAHSEAGLPKDEPRGVVVDLSHDCTDLRLVWWSPENQIWHDGPTGRVYLEEQFRCFFLFPDQNCD